MVFLQKRYQWQLKRRARPLTALIRTPPSSQRWWTGITSTTSSSAAAVGRYTLSSSSCLDWCPRWLVGLLVFFAPDRSLRNAFRVFFWHLVFIVGACEFLLLSDSLYKRVSFSSFVLIYDVSVARWEVEDRIDLLWSLSCRGFLGFHQDWQLKSEKFFFFFLFFLKMFL